MWVTMIPISSTCPTKGDAGSHQRCRHACGHRAHQIDLHLIGVGAGELCKDAGGLLLKPRGADGFQETAQRWRDGHGRIQSATPRVRNHAWTDQSLGGCSARAPAWRAMRFAGPRASSRRATTRAAHAAGLSTARGREIRHREQLEHRRGPPGASASGCTRRGGAGASSSSRSSSASARWCSGAGSAISRSGGLSASASAPQPARARSAQRNQITDRAAEIIQLAASWRERVRMGRDQCLHLDPVAASSAAITCADMSCPRPRRRRPRRRARGRRGGGTVDLHVHRARATAMSGTKAAAACWWARRESSITSSQVSISRSASASLCAQLPSATHQIGAADQATELGGHLMRAIGHLREIAHERHEALSRRPAASGDRRAPRDAHRSGSAPRRARAISRPATMPSPTSPVPPQTTAIGQSRRTPSSGSPAGRDAVARAAIAARDSGSGSAPGQPRASAPAAAVVWVRVSGARRGGGCRARWRKSGPGNQARLPTRARHRHVRGRRNGKRVGGCLLTTTHPTHTSRTSDAPSEVERPRTAPVRLTVRGSQSLASDCADLGAGLRWPAGQESAARGCPPGLTGRDPGPSRSCRAAEHRVPGVRGIAVAVLQRQIKHRESAQRDGQRHARVRGAISMHAHDPERDHLAVVAENPQFVELATPRRGGEPRAVKSTTLPSAEVNTAACASACVGASFANRCRATCRAREGTGSAAPGSAGAVGGDEGAASGARRRPPTTPRATQAIAAPTARAGRSCSAARCRERRATG